MLGELFYWVFNMSLIASAMGAVVLLLRRFKRVPRRISVFLWAVPFIRMCVPVGLNSPYSLMTLISRLTTKTVTVYEPSADLAFSCTNVVMAANSDFPITYKVNILGGVFGVAGVVWAVVSVGILIALTILYFGTKREISDARPAGENVYYSDKVQSPAVYGVFRPKIVLPAAYENIDTKYVLRHKRAHIRRKDNLWRLLGFLAVAVHWFNPLSWVFLKCFLADLELACDEAAISGYNEEERKEYARTLLSCAQGKNLFVSAFGGAKTRTRIENVISYKKMTWFSAAGFAALVIAIAFVLLTNAG